MVKSKLFASNLDLEYKWNKILYLEFNNETKRKRLLSNEIGKLYAFGMQFMG